MQNHPRRTPRHLLPVELYRGKGRYVRHRSPSDVIEEIQSIQSKGATRRIYFADETVVLFPWLLPIVKLLVRLPANPLFRLWFGLVYFLVYVKSEGRDVLSTFRTAFKNGYIIKKR